MDARIKELKAYLASEDLPVGKGKFSVGKHGNDVYIVQGVKKLQRLGVLDDSNRTLREAFEAFLSPSAEAMSILQLRRSLHAEKQALGTSPQTLRKYEPAMRMLDQRNPLSEESLVRAISSTTPGTQHRRMVANYFKFACELHGVEWTPRLVRLSQKGQRIKRKEQPFFTDEQLEAQAQVKLLPHWQKIHRLLMIYGLRPWEAFIAQPCKTHPGNVWIGEGKKVARGETKPRSVPPFHKRWFVQYDMAALMAEPNPPTELDWKAFKSIANQRVNQRFRGNGLYGMEASAYGFRNAYARRMHLQYEIIQTHGALFMGHSLATHLSVYQEWIGASSDPYAQLSD